jgi:hypothetical protein
MDEVRVPQPIGRPRTRPLRLAGDKGYSFPQIREWLRRHHIEAVIPQRKDQRERHQGRALKFDREAYREGATWWSDAWVGSRSVGGWRRGMRSWR